MGKKMHVSWIHVKSSVNEKSLWRQYESAINSKYVLILPSQAQEATYIMALSMQ